MSNPAVLPHHIVEYPTGYRVFLMRNRQVHEKRFSFARCRGQTREQALAAAVAWRDQVLATLPTHTHGLHRGGYSKVVSCLRQPESGTRVGVSRLLHRRVSVKGAEDRVYVVYWVCYAVQGTKPGRATRTKGFYAGNVDTLTDADERHAYQSAVAFREHWEHSRDTGTPFDPLPYKRWRTVTCYPFVPPAC